MRTVRRVIVEENEKKQTSNSEGESFTSKLITS
jgi:hypothetical protein